MDSAQIVPHLSNPVDTPQSHSRSSQKRHRWTAAYCVVYVLQRRKRPCWMFSSVRHKWLAECRRGTLAPAENLQGSAKRDRPFPRRPLANTAHKQLTDRKEGLPTKEKKSCRRPFSSRDFGDGHLLENHVSVGGQAKEGSTSNHNQYPRPNGTLTPQGRIVARDLDFSFEALTPFLQGTGQQAGYGAAVSACQAPKSPSLHRLEPPRQDSHSASWAVTD